MKFCKSLSSQACFSWLLHALLCLRLWWLRPDYMLMMETGTAIIDDLDSFDIEVALFAHIQKCPVASSPTCWNKNEHAESFEFYYLRTGVGQWSHVCVTTQGCWRPLLAVTCVLDWLGSLMRKAGECVMGLLPDMQNCRLRMRRECRERFPPPPISKETVS